MPDSQLVVGRATIAARSRRARSHACAATACCQPPAARLSVERRDALADFYTDHADRVRRRVAQRSNVHDPDVLDDACAFAWLQVVRRGDVALDRRGLAWLTLVGAQEAWSLRSSICPTPVARGAADPVEDDDDVFDPPGPAADPLDRVIARDAYRTRVRCLMVLTPAQRRALLLQAAGYDYREIMRLTTGTYSAVNRWLRIGRSAIRSSATR